MAQGLAHRHDFAVILVIEIGKRVHPTTRKKALPWAGGIAPLEGSLQEGCEARWRGDLQALDDPARQVIASIQRQRLELLG